MEEMSKIENNGCCVWASLGEFTAEIYGEVKGLDEIYISKLLNWAATAWTYDQVEKWEWKQSEEFAESSGPGYYVIWPGKPSDDAYFLHICDRDDEKGLFTGAWADSPVVLADYKQKISRMQIRIEKEMSYPECTICGNQCPQPVFEAVGCPFCGAEIRIRGGDEEAEALDPLDCEEQQKKGLCGECMSPTENNCDLRQQ